MSFHVGRPRSNVCTTFLRFWQLSETPAEIRDSKIFLHSSTKPSFRFAFALSASQVHVIKKRRGLLQINVFHQFLPHQIEILLLSIQFHVIHVYVQEKTLLTMHKQASPVCGNLSPIHVPTELFRIVFPTVRRQVRARLEGQQRDIPDLITPLRLWTKLLSTRPSSSRTPWRVYRSVDELQLKHWQELVGTMPSICFPPRAPGGIPRYSAAVPVSSRGLTADTCTGKLNRLVASTRNDPKTPTCERAVGHGSSQKKSNLAPLKAPSHPP